jgi:hypothetical protein
MRGKERLRALGMAALVIAAALAGRLDAAWPGTAGAVTKAAAPTDDWRPRNAAVPIQQDAVQAGVEDGFTLYPCRAAHDGGLHIGRLRADFRGCHIGYAGSEVEVAPYEMLTATWVQESDGQVPAGALAAGADPMLSAAEPYRVAPLLPCRAAWRGGLHPGEVHADGCAFGFGGRQMLAASYEVLVLAPWMMWQVASPGALSDSGITAGNEGGEPFYLCRAAAAGGLHVGKIKRGSTGCGVVAGAQETIVERFELLVARWHAGTEGTMPVDAMPAGRENGASQYVCRGQSSDTVQIGKVSENLSGCHVGMQGSEIVLADYQVLGE